MRDAAVTEPTLAKFVSQHQPSRFETHDVRFPTSLTGDGTDAMNTGSDCSSPCVSLFALDPALTGYGMTFTIGRGNDIVCAAIEQLALNLLAQDLEELFMDMGKTWEYLNADLQLRWIGPEKGAVDIALGAVDNALWDLFARSRGKPLWKLVVDLTPELVKAEVEVYFGCDHEGGRKEGEGGEGQRDWIPRICLIGGMAR
ncbi:enolase N-terminal domain-like protein [Macrolepiota fuliginosa MF-IS2]|uniref:Enolase N-terminal domain-like protein n=1 Tax=Macrolepiota fuliginosa MF-IS2 TaxID=1400762 RepID=A0A9P6BXP7_9AGAR|nr:enolase N-terminal domain-like protein [Macrolepiota fuliginosa MF-IS2]